MIIIFVGPPGSGKSTQTRLLSKVLKSKGQKVVVLSLKRGFTTSIIEKTLYTTIYGRNRLYPYPLELLLRGAKAKLRRIVYLWFIINTFELYSRILLLLALNRMGRLILVEDYVPVAILDYVYVTMKLEIPIGKVWGYIKALIRLYLKAYPSKVVVLNSTMEELIRRWSKRGRAEHSRMYLLTLQRVLPRLINALTRNPDKDTNLLDTTSRSVLDTLRDLIRGLRCLRVGY